MDITFYEFINTIKMTQDEWAAAILTVLVIWFVLRD